MLHHRIMNEWIDGWVLCFYKFCFVLVGIGISPSLYFHFSRCVSFFVGDDSDVSRSLSYIMNYVRSGSKDFSKDTGTLVKKIIIVMVEQTSLL